MIYICKKLKLYDTAKKKNVTQSIRRRRKILKYNFTTSYKNYTFCVGQVSFGKKGGHNVFHNYKESEINVFDSISLVRANICLNG